MRQLKLFVLASLALGGILMFTQNANAQVGYGISELYYYENSSFLEGDSETVFTNYNANYYYIEISVTGTLYSSYGVALDYNDGYGGGTFVTTTTSAFNVTRGQQYELISEHSATAYFSRYNGFVTEYFDWFGLSLFDGDYDSPHDFSEGPTTTLYNQTFRIASTRKTIQVPLAAPHITQIGPDAVIQADSTIPVQIEGTNFGTNPTINVSGGGVSATYVQQLPTGIEAHFQITANADIGNHNVTVTANGQTSNSVVFRVGDLSPHIDSISPSEAAAGASGTVTITGTNFGLNPDLNITAFSGVSLNITSRSSTLIEAQFTVNSSASEGSRDVSVFSHGVSGNGFIQGPGNSATSNSVDFQVTTTNTTVQFSSLPVVEKNGERVLSVTVRNLVNSSDTTKLTFKTATGTMGAAKFIDASGNEVNEIVINGEVENKAVRIKGITESSQANNLKVEARIGNATVVKAAREFTVATITSLVFERFDTTYTALDDNPGVDGTHTAGEGRRIFPDKNDVADVTSGGKDRALVKVIATVSPTLPNVQVYFGSYDLDDPSAAGLPIDTTGNNGNDNNGAANFSKSGVFPLQSGITCTAGDPSILSQTGCSIASDGTATAAFKTTMQPGDNFAIAASLTDTYRDSITVNSSDGSKLIYTGNKTIPISSEANTDNVPAIRTEMLTVWRRLHIEVDSMGNVTGNKVTGTINSTGQTSCPPPPPAPPTPCTVNTGYFITTDSGLALETDRFQGGRIEISPTRSYDVVGNHAGDVVLDGTPSGATKLRFPQAFTLYDDDDFNDDDGTTARPLHGDEGEVLPEPDTTLNTSLIFPTDTPCSNTITDNCNILAPAYIKPIYDLVGSHGKTPFILNLPMSVDILAGPPVPTDVQAAFNFNNAMYSQLDNFWTIYISTAYQVDIRWDRDPDTTSGVGGITDASSGAGQGCLLFLETTRAKEASHWNIGPNNRNYTMAHEIGHKFGAFHMDSDLMATTFTPGSPPIYRTVGTFSDITLNRMRNIMYP